MQDFNTLYPTIEDVVKDMHEVIANVCETRAERAVLIRRMNELVESGIHKIDLYTKMTEEIQIHNEIDGRY